MNSAITLNRHGGRLSHAATKATSSAAPIVTISTLDAKGLRGNG